MEGHQTMGEGSKGALYFWEQDGVLLRAFEDRDAEQLTKMLTDTENRRQADCGVGLAVCESDGAFFLEMVSEKTEQGSEIWLAISDGGGECNGYCSLTDLDERNGHAQLFVTVFCERQGEGIAKKAACILLRYAFWERRLHKVNCCVMEGNRAGRRFAQSLGFAEECVRADMFYSQGVYHDEYYYGMLREEYDARVRGGKATGQAEEKARQDKAVVPKKLPPAGTGRYFWEYDGVRLRGMRESDCIKNNEIYRESEVCRFYDNDVKLPCNEDRLTDFDLDHLDLGGGDGRLVFAAENEAGEYVGNVHLAGLDEKNGKFSFSIYMCREMRGRGYGARALFLVLSYAFFELRMHKCNTSVSEKNAASLALMRKLGFVTEGLQRENVYYNGSYVNDIFLGITKERFSELFY